MSSSFKAFALSVSMAICAFAKDTANKDNMMRARRFMSFSETEDGANLNGGSQFIVQLRCHVDLGETDAIAKAETQDAWVGLGTGTDEEKVYHKHEDAPHKDVSAHLKEAPTAFEVESAFEM